jgi:hypothetical protein
VVVEAAVIDVTAAAVAVNGGGGSADGGGGFTDAGSGFADDGGGFGQGYASCGDDAGWLIETIFWKNSYFSLKISGWRNNWATDPNKVPFPSYGSLVIFFNTSVSKYLQLKCKIV